METPQAKRARTAGVDALSVTEMKSLIQSAGLSSKDCVEKSDLRKRSREALARLDEARPSKAQRASKSPPAPAPAAAASNDVDAMSVKDLKALIGRAGLSCLDCAEKSELRARAREALARLEEARRLEAQRRAAEAPPPPRPRQTARSATYAPATYAADAAADEPKREQLVQMGFEAQQAAGALVFAGGDVACSAALLRAWAEWEASRSLPAESVAAAYPPVRALRERLLFLGEFGEMTVVPTVRRQESVLDRKVDGRRRGLDVTLHEGFMRPADATALLRALTAPTSHGGEGLGVSGGRSRTWPGLRSPTTNGTLATIARRIEGVFGLPGGAITYAAIQYYSEREGYRTGIGSHPDREVDDAVGIYCVSLMEDQDATRPLSINPSRHYRDADGPVSIKDIELPHGSLYALRPPTNEWWEHKLKPHKATRVSITFRRKQYLGPRPPTRNDSKFVRSDVNAGVAYEVSAGTCECKDLIFKRFVGQKRGYCCKHMKAAFPKVEK